MLVVLVDLFILLRVHFFHFPSVRIKIILLQLHNLFLQLFDVVGHFFSLVDVVLKFHIHNLFIFVFGVEVDLSVLKQRLDRLKLLAWTHKVEICEILKEGHFVMIGFDPQGILKIFGFQIFIPQGTKVFFVLHLFVNIDYYINNIK